MRRPPNKRASGVEITQTSRRNRAKNLQNFRNFGAPRAQNLRALGRRALLKPQNIVASLHRVGSALHTQKNPSDGQRSRNSSAKLARNHCKIPRILARRGQRSCLKSASVRCVIQTTSLWLLNESAMHPNAKKCASGIDVTQFLGQSRAKKLQNFRNFRRVARTKTA